MVRKGVNLISQYSEKGLTGCFAKQGKGPNGHILRLICSAKLVATFNQCGILGASLLGNTAQIDWDLLFICIGISHSECSECRLLCDQSLGDFDGLTRDFENVIEMTPCLNTMSYGCDTWRILHHSKHLFVIFYIDYTYISTLISYF